LKKKLLASAIVISGKVSLFITTELHQVKILKFRQLIFSNGKSFKKLKKEIVSFIIFGASLLPLVHVILGADSLFLSKDLEGKPSFMLKHKTGHCLGIIG